MCVLKAIKVQTLSPRYISTETIYFRTMKCRLYPAQFFYTDISKMLYLCLGLTIYSSERQNLLSRFRADAIKIRITCLYNVQWNIRSL